MSKNEHIQTNLFEINTDAIPDISSIFGDPQKAEPEVQTRKNGAGGGEVTTKHLSRFRN